MAGVSSVTITGRNVKFEEALEGYFVFVKFHAVPIMVADFQNNLFQTTR
jgi:hypothetical protein